MGGTVSLVLLLLFLWGLCSQRVERVELTAPAVFVLVGLVLATCLGSMDLAPSRETVQGLAEICLTWILFADAARLSFRVLRPDLGIYLRLLLIGLPLCIALGALLASGLLPGVSGWAAVFVGAALAPTDAALGASMMSDPVVPERVRRLINVESGLNDGIATPVVVVALAGAASAAGAGPDADGQAVVELAIGLAYGSALGLAGGWLLRSALRKGWAAEEFAGPAVLALALLSYLSSIAIGGNGFVAAFVAGLAFGTAYGDAPQSQLLFTEQSASVLSLLVWLLFGAVLVPAAVPHMTWQAVLYAVLSLTVVRGWCPWPWRCSVRGWAVPRSCSSAGSAPGGWPRSSSVCSRSRTLPRLSHTKSFPCSSARCCSVSSPTDSARGRSRDATGQPRPPEILAGRNCRRTASLSGGSQAAQTQPDAGVPATDSQFARRAWPVTGCGHLAQGRQHGSVDRSRRDDRHAEVRTGRPGDGARRRRQPACASSSRPTCVRRTLLRQGSAGCSWSDDIEVTRATADPRLRTCT
ncbi:cation:proton antiporter [Streptomyces sp. NBC_00623]|uniref:cation:proton antiporter domain-containing protein n=1 Tax=Streptomyces sp. NBC_00623 TaxID=2975790 RepID=UPI0030E2F021